jgi:hypothetical protein
VDLPLVMPTWGSLNIVSLGGARVRGVEVIICSGSVCSSSGNSLVPPPFLHLLGTRMGPLHWGIPGHLFVIGSALWCAPSQCALPIHLVQQFATLYGVW